jgi:hypothetical protein
LPRPLLQRLRLQMLLVDVDADSCWLIMVVGCWMLDVGCWMLDVG